MALLQGNYLLLFYLYICLEDPRSYTDGSYLVISVLGLIYFDNNFQQQHRFFFKLSWIDILLSTRDDSEAVASKKPIIFYSYFEAFNKH